MNKNSKHYRFINGMTGNVIFFLSCPPDAKNEDSILESTRRKLAYEKGMHIEQIYYSKDVENDPED